MIGGDFATRNITSEPSYSVITSSNRQIPFSCASSYLLANERTLEELAKLTPEPVHMDNFRPSIIIDGAAPFLEVIINGYRSLVAEICNIGLH